MASFYGDKLKVSIFGQSHSGAIGVVVDGIPAGVRVDTDELGAFLSRRAPGGGATGGLTTARAESDEPEFLSGLIDVCDVGAAAGSGNGDRYEAGGVNGGENGGVTADGDETGGENGGGTADGDEADAGAGTGAADARGGSAGRGVERSELSANEAKRASSRQYTCGAPLAIVIRNRDARSSDYDELRSVPRPAHADFSAFVKYGGFADIRGGGHFSGRLTAPLCAAGGICLQALRALGVSIGAHALSVGSGADARDEAFDPVGVSESTFSAVLSNARDLFPVVRRDAGEAMRKAVLEAGAAGDSIGGIVECAAVGVSAGWGDPMFDGVENRVARAVFGIPGVKGIEFGSGFAGSSLRGSQNNDAFYYDGDGRVRTKTNNSGGILGGITNGMPIIFRAAFKPTPSIAASQDSVNLTRRENAQLSVKGRHDPCIVARAIPCVEAAFAIALYDSVLCANISNTI